MAITLAQNFYKATVSIAWSAGAGNFYVSTKPTISEGYLVLSPNNASLREIVKFTAIGTDGSGDYVTITLANRGLGGTTDQAHAVGEAIYMNITSLTLEEISDAIDQIVAAGAQDASTSTKGIVKLNVAPASASEPIAVGINDTTILPTTDEKAALSGGGDFGTPSGSNKFVTEEYLPNSFVPPQVVVFTSSGTWTKDAGLKYIIVEGVGGGGGCDTDPTEEEAGGGGGYFRKLILASALGATETVTIGAAGTVGPTPTNGGTTSFGSHASANGGVENGAGGTATGGDINIQGQAGRQGSTGTGANYPLSGSTPLGLGGVGNSAPTGYGSGGIAGEDAKPGIVIVTEYYA